MQTHRSLRKASLVVALNFALAFGVLPGRLGTPAVAAAAPSFHLLHEIPIPGEGGWDYLAVDPAGKRLYVSHATETVVIDLAKRAVVGTIADTPGVHGIALAPDLGKGFVSCGRENKVAIVDLATLKTVQKVETGANPDAILYEPKHHEVYAFNGRAHSATVIDAKTGKVVTTIELPGKPEFAVEDEKAGRIYNNIEDKNEVVALDVASHAVVATWPIGPGESASGMAIDLAHHRLFLGCDNKLMVMMDSQNGKVVGSVPIGEGVDANAFDSSSQLAFSSNGGAGTVTVAHEASPSQLQVVETITTAPRSKTMTIDPITHHLYVAAAKFGAPSGESKRPQVVPGTMKVMVYGTGSK